jgi:thioredoxin 1
VRTTLTGVVVLLCSTVLALSSCASGTTDDAGGARPAATSSSATTSSATSSAAGSTPATGTTSAPSAAPGAYLTRGEYQDQMAARGDTAVVLFFHASWCPDCRATEAAIDESGVPDGLTVVKVDFDSETELRRQYGVTQQHTFVQVDADGAEIRKWTGSADGEAILAETA